METLSTFPWHVSVVFFTFFSELQHFLQTVKGKMFSAVQKYLLLEVFPVALQTRYS